MIILLFCAASVHATYIFTKISTTTSHAVITFLVEERIEKMKARGHEMICKVKGAFAVEILKLPMVTDTERFIMHTD